MNRHVLLLLHRYAGLFMAFFLVIAGVTGTVIAFYDELEPALNPELYYVEKQGEHLPLDEILDRVEESTLQGKALVRLVHYPTHENDAIRIILVPNEDPETGEEYPLENDSIFANPYTGEVLGQRYFGAWRFDRAHIVPLLYKLHYSLTIPWPWGYWIFGAAAVVWVLDSIWSIFLTFPRARRNFMQKWRKAWTIKWGAGSARFIRDSHLALSLWLWGMMMMLAISSVMFNLNHEIYQPVLSSFVEYEHARDKVPAPTDKERAHTISFGEAVTIGRQHMTQWQQEESFDIYHEDSISMDFGKHAYRIRSKTSLDLPESYAQTQLYISAYDGRVLVKSHPYVDTGNAISTWLGALHMGRVFGFWYKLVIALMGLVVAGVTITGVLIWWRKRGGFRAKAHK